MKNRFGIRETLNPLTCADKSMDMIYIHIFFFKLDLSVMSWTDQKKEEKNCMEIFYHFLTKVAISETNVSVLLFTTKYCCVNQFDF